MGCITGGARVTGPTERFWRDSAAAWAAKIVACGLLVLLVTWLLHFVLAWTWRARLGLTLGIGLVLAGISFARFVSDADSYR